MPSTAFTRRSTAVSVPYRSGRPLEHQLEAAMNKPKLVFQSPIARGGHWSRRRYSSSPTSTSFSPLSLGEAIGADHVDVAGGRLAVSVPYRSGRPLEQLPVHILWVFHLVFQSPIARGGHWSVVAGLVLVSGVKFQSPIARGGHWSRHPEGPAGRRREVSVPYRSGRPLEPAVARELAGAVPLFQSPIARGGHWSRPLKTWMARAMRVSVPYRSGRPLEQSRSAPWRSLPSGFQSPIARGGHWSAGIQYVTLVTFKFQSPIARGGHWSSARSCDRSVQPSVSVPYRSGRPLEQHAAWHRARFQAFQSPIARGGHWSPARAWR